MRRRQKIVDVIGELRHDDHVAILNVIIEGHSGAEWICVQYNAPGITLETICYVKETFDEAGWTTKILKPEEPDGHSETLIVLNFSAPNGAREDYREFTYTREPKDFWFPPGFDEKHRRVIEILAHHIEVTLWDLWIVPHEVCMDTE